MFSKIEVAVLLRAGANPNLASAKGDRPGQIAAYLQRIVGTAWLQAWNEADIVLSHIRSAEWFSS